MVANTLTVKRNFIEIDNLEEKWTIVSILICIPLYIMLYHKVSFFNFYFQVVFWGIQIYFFLASQVETIIFSPQKITYKFLFIRYSKKIEGYKTQSIKFNDSYQSRKTNYIYTEAIYFYKNEKSVFKIVKENWDFAYPKIKQYSQVHYPLRENYKLPTFSFYYHNETNLFFGYLVFVTTLFTLGVYIENPKSTPIEKVVYIEGKLFEKPKLIKAKNDHHYRFIIDKNPSKKLNLSISDTKSFRYKFYFDEFKMGDSIGFYITEEDFYFRFMEIEKYPYFTRHIMPLNKMYIQSYVYRGEHFLDPYEQIKGRTYNQKERFLLPLIFVFGFLLNIFYRKIKYRPTE